jgi:hypothetical protein
LNPPAALNLTQLMFGHFQPGFGEVKHLASAHHLVGFIRRDRPPTDGAMFRQVNFYPVRSLYRPQRFTFVTGLPSEGLLLFGKRWPPGWFLAIPVAAGWLVAVLAVQPQATPQFGILRRQTSVLFFQARPLCFQACFLCLEAGQPSFQISHSLQQQIGSQP